ncbi:MAG TPA: tetratricopeptide repeat protein [Planctomycetota bacterium]
MAARTLGGVKPGGYVGGGGVKPGGYRGGGSSSGSWDCDPWGWDSCWNGGFYVGVGFGWGWGWGCSWGYPWYWSCYYPAWWWWSYPNYYYDYCAYPATTVIYTQPATEVVYVETASEPVGEGVVGAPANGAVAPPAAAPSALSIAAQRYLDLGDRAFREGRYTDAVQFYAKAVEFAPDQGALYLVLADALFAAGDYHYAAYAIRRSVELDPALLETRVDKHGFYPDPALFDQQLAALEDYLFRHADDRDARLVLALNYLFGARPADAVRTLANTSVSQDPAAQKVLDEARAAQ